MGSVLGLIGYICNPFVNAWALAGGAKIITAFISSIFLIPYPVLPNRAGALFPFNSPAWSLFMEYLANIVYALVLYRMKRMWLVPVTIAAAVWLCMVGHQQGWLIGGWDAPTCVDGIARISYSFLAGLLVFRFWLMIKNRLNFIWLGLLLMGAFFFPHVKQDGLAEAAIVLFFFPLLLTIGAGANVSGWWKQVCIISSLYIRQN